MSTLTRMRTPDGTPVHISLLSGHSFVVSDPHTEVPEMFRKEAFARGCIPVAAPRTAAAQVDQPANFNQALVTATVSAPNVPSADAPSAPPKNQMQIVVEAIETILVRNIVSDLTNSGQPKIDVLRKVAGFNVDKVLADEAWRQVLAQLEAEAEAERIAAIQAATGEGGEGADTPANDNGPAADGEGAQGE